MQIAPCPLLALVGLSKPFMSLRSIPDSLCFTFLLFSAQFAHSIQIRFNHRFHFRRFQNEGQTLKRGMIDEMRQARAPDFALADMFVAI